MPPLPFDANGGPRRVRCCLTGIRNKGLPWTRSKQRGRYTFGIICASTSPRSCNGLSLGMKTSGLHIWRVKFRNDVLHGNARIRIESTEFFMKAFPHSLYFFPTRCCALGQHRLYPLSERDHRPWWHFMGVCLLLCYIVRSNEPKSLPAQKNDEIIFNTAYRVKRVRIGNLTRCIAWKWSGKSSLTGARIWYTSTVHMYEPVRFTL